MSVINRRIDTIKVLIAGSGVAAHGDCSDIIDELTAAQAVQRIPQAERKHLLQVIHACRAFDTFLHAFLDQYGCKKKLTGIGSCLIELEKSPPGKVAKLPPTSSQRFNTSIAKVRNRYMHKAGEFPKTESQVTALVSEMDSCTAVIVQLQPP